MNNQDLINEMTDSMEDIPTIEEILPGLKKAAAGLKQNPDYVASLLQAHFVASMRMIMREDDISANTLAERLNKSRQYVSRVLNENANFTIRSIAEIVCALKLNIQFHISRTEPNFQVLHNFKMKKFCLQPENEFGKEEPFYKKNFTIEKPPLKPPTIDNLKLGG